MTRPGIEPRSPGPLASTLTIMPLSGSFMYTEILHNFLVSSIENQFFDDEGR